MLLGCRFLLGMVVVATGGFDLIASAAKIVEFKSGLIWPEPKAVDPGGPGKAPSDAIPLFDGKTLAKWVDGDKWLVAGGVATSREKSIHTKDSFGDCQLHLEWAAPEKVVGVGQGRGNSGVFLLGKYEVQILDSFHNETYFDGQCGSIYKQHPPLVNACRKPGEWQSYDILFKGPRFDAQGKLLKPGYVTLLHNGLLVQNHFELQGDTSYVRAPRYEAHPQKAPLELQFHGNPVRFRNIWIRELIEEQPPKRIAPPGPVQPEPLPESPTVPTKKRPGLRSWRPLQRPACP